MILLINDTEQQQQHNYHIVSLHIDVKFSSDI